MRRQSFITFGIVLVALSGALAKKEPAIPTTATKPKQVALVRVNVTGQGYDYFRPWQKKAPFSKRALGAVLPKGRVLVTADLVTNQNYVELERAESGEKTAANVRVIDYEANLALLEPAEKSFLDGITPLEITSDTVVGDRLSAWQLEPTGALLATDTTDVLAWRDEALMLNLAGFGPDEHQLMIQSRIEGLRDILDLDLDAFGERVRSGADELGMDPPSDLTLEGWWDQARTLEDE